MNFISRNGIGAHVVEVCSVLCTMTHSLFDGKVSIRQSMYFDRYQEMEAFTAEDLNQSSQGRQCRGLSLVLLVSL